MKEDHLKDHVKIRPVRAEDLQQVAAIEAVCFPPEEAAQESDFSNRIQVFPDTFLVAELDGRIVGFVNGCATDSPVIYDALYHDASLHRPEAKNLAIFGLDVLPEYRRQGIAARLMKAFLELARAQDREGLILTCKEPLIYYYEKFGFVNQGVSKSTHGGAVWYDMICQCQQSRG